MDNQKLIIRSHAISACVMSVVLTLPCVVEAVSIGEVVSQSKLGEPLSAQIELEVRSDEHLENSCLSLAEPDPLEKDSGGYLTQADLSIKIDGARQYVTVTSRKLFNDAFARLLLRIKCPGMGSITKLLTILPDLGTPVLQAPIAVPLAAEETAQPVSIPSEGHNIASSANQTVRQSEPPESGKHLANKAVRSVHRHHLAAEQTVSKEPHRADTPKLVLSSDSIDESRFGKVGTEKRAWLLAKQRQRDDDEQMVRFLAMQNQIKQLKEELGAMQAQLTHLGVMSAPLAGSASSPEPSVGKENQLKPTIVVKQPVEQRNNAYVSKGLLVTLGFVLSILALWLGLRYHTKKYSRNEIPLQKAFEPILKFSRTIFPAKPLATVPAPEVVEPPKANTLIHETEPPLSSSHKKVDELDEEEIILEEAGLYASHGRPAKAAGILQEILKRNPSKIDAWYILLSIYSSLGKTAEFEKAAREFFSHHKDCPTWNKIQALGRTLDKSNPLYADNANDHISTDALLPDEASPLRSVGDIMIKV